MRMRLTVLSKKIQIHKARGRPEPPTRTTRDLVAVAVTVGDVAAIEVSRGCAGDGAGLVIRPHDSANDFLEIGRCDAGQNTVFRFDVIHWMNSPYEFRRALVGVAVAGADVDAVFGPRGEDGRAVRVSRQTTDDVTEIRGDHARQNPVG